MILHFLTLYWIIQFGLIINRNCIERPENEAREWLVHDWVAVNELKQVHVTMFLHHHLIS